METKRNLKYFTSKGISPLTVIGLLLMGPVTIPLIQNIGIEIQRAKNMHQFRSKVYFFMALGNVAISIPLGMAFGGVGCALGTAISMIVGNGLVMNWYYHKRIGLNMVYFWKNIVSILPAMIVPAVLGLAAVSMAIGVTEIRLLMMGIP